MRKSDSISTRKAASDVHEFLIETNTTLLNHTHARARCGEAVVVLGGRWTSNKGNKLRASFKERCVEVSS